MKPIALILLMLFALSAASAQTLGDKLRSMLPSAPVASNTISIHFEWQSSPSPGIQSQRLRYGPETNNLMFETVLMPDATNATIVISSLPIHASITAVNFEGMESLPSNMAGVLGVQMIVTNFAQTSTDLVAWQDIGAINVQTNASFTRIRQERTEKKVTYP